MRSQRFAVGGEDDFLDGGLMPQHASEAFAGRGVPEDDVAGPIGSLAGGATSVELAPHLSRREFS